MKLLWTYCALALLFLIGPIFVVVAGSFTAGATIAFPPDGLGLRWYRVFLDDADFRASARISLEVALASGALATLLGTSAAIALARHRIPGRQLVEAFIGLPLGIPAVVLGLAFLVLYTEMGFGGTMAAIIAGHVVFITPFVVRLVRASFTGFNPNLERAAAGLGASPFTVFRLITLPLVRAGIVGGFVFACVLSFDEVVISLFLSGPNAITLPVRIFTYLDQSPGPVVMAAGSVLVALALVVFALLELTIGVSRAFGLEDR